MTTIAYNHPDRQIAVDGRTCCGDRIETDVHKKYLKTEEGDTFIFAGVVGDCSLLVDFFYGRADKNDVIPDCVAFVITAEGAAIKFIVPEDGYPIIEPLVYDSAIGSGADFALAEMDHGGTAKQAVKYAMTRNVHTGGKITVFNLPKQP